MSRVVINANWRGPQTKRTERLRIETTSRLCKELGLQKPVVRINGREKA